MKIKSLYPSGNYRFGKNGLNLDKTTFEIDVWSENLGDGGQPNILVP